MKLGKWVPASWLYYPGNEQHIYIRPDRFAVRVSVSDAGAEAAYKAPIKDESGIEVLIIHPGSAGHSNNACGVQILRKNGLQYEVLYELYVELGSKGPPAFQSCKHPAQSTTIGKHFLGIVSEHFGEGYTAHITEKLQANASDEPPFDRLWS